MGIPNPVTRETHGTGDKYYSQLAKELAKALHNPLKVFIIIVYRRSICDFKIKRLMIKIVLSTFRLGLG